VKRSAPSSKARSSTASSGSLPVALTLVLSAVFVSLSLPVEGQTSPQSNSQSAFQQGQTMGRSGNTQARGTIRSNTATAQVPGYAGTPPQTSQFGNPNLGTAAGSVTAGCSTPAQRARPSPECAAVQFSQGNPTQRAPLTLRDTDPLLTRGRTITANPQSIAGSIAGTYSACSVIEQKAPDRYVTERCHEYRQLEYPSCDHVLVVTPVFTPGCTPGEFLTKVVTDPCPECVDVVHMDFSCTGTGYQVHAYTQTRDTDELHTELGVQHVPGAVGLTLPRTAGPSNLQGGYCYETWFSQTCNAQTCTIQSGFSNPCQSTQVQSQNTFAIPMKVSFEDRWEDDCGALEGRSR
jgi:hypothetical protein